jgi:hypothetical protein
MDLATLNSPNGLSLVSANGGLLAQERIECELRFKPSNWPTWVKSFSIASDNMGRLYLPRGDYFFARLFPGNARGLGLAWGHGFGGAGILGDMGSSLYAELDLASQPWADAGEPAAIRASHVAAPPGGGAPRVREWDIQFPLSALAASPARMTAARYLLRRADGALYRMDWTSDHQVTPVLGNGE